MLIDTHCHLDFPDFDCDRELVLERAKHAGVIALLNVASSLKGSHEAVGLAARHANIFASVGIHPHDAKDCRPEDFPEIKQLLAKEKVVAIGEVGLDYFRNLSDPKLQVDIFRKFIHLALESNRPLIIHSRQAEDDTLSILDEFKSFGLTAVVIHCFSGDVDFLKKCLDRGFFVSFTCNVTYKKAQKLKEVVQYTPLERMFLETDAPYLSPEGKRGRRNEPAYMIELAGEVSRIKSLDFEKVCCETTKNAMNFFKLKLEVPCPDRKSL